MDIHQLELFLAVLDASSMTRAAEKFYLSPAAVSFQMHNLALELNTELFVREGKKVNPTPAALRLAEHARSILKLTGQIKQEFDDDPSKDSRPFHFATGVTTLIYQLGKPLRLLRKQYPTADIRVTVGVTEEIVAGLHERRFDLGLISLPVATDGLKILPLFDEELLLLQPSARRQSGGPKQSVRPEELATVPFVFYPKRSNVRLLIDQFFEKIGITPRVVMEPFDTETIKSLVESGFGWSILPEHALRQRSRLFRTFRIEGHHLKRTLALASVSTAYPRRLTDSVASYLAGLLRAD
jgi:LysR family nitrogen assimilation transcriptional regulator